MARVSSVLPVPAGSADGVDAAFATNDVPDHGFNPWTALGIVRVRRQGPGLRSVAGLRRLTRPSGCLSVAAFMNIDVNQNECTLNCSGSARDLSPLAARLTDRLDGPLFFPVTAYGPDGAVDLDVFRAHVRRRRRGRRGRRLRLLRHGRVPRADAGGVPARASPRPSRRPPGGCPWSRAPATAPRWPSGTRASPRRPGADGLLAMPPYLVVADQEGLLRHYAALAAATSLDVIVYQRDNAVFTPETVVELAQVAGHHRPQGRLRRPRPDPAHRQRRPHRAARPGLPLLQRPAHRRTHRPRLPGHRRHALLLGRLRFAPEIALAFHRALGAGDDATVNRLLDGFYRPLVDLRDQGRGYAVSLVKAGVRLRGLDVGEVRPPLLGADAPRTSRSWPNSSSAARAAGAAADRTRRSPR